jgi:hypothetical protein
MDNDGVTRCRLPTEVEYRYILNSTDGPLENAKIRCARGHLLNGPIAFLTVPVRSAAVSASLPPPLTVQGALPHL